MSKTTRGVSPKPSKAAGEDNKDDHFLLPQHQELLDESAISSEVASARRYRSTTTKADLRRLGFKDSQCHIPGLLIPVWSVTGEIVNYQLRSDLPRINRKTGKVIKYETVAGSRMALDIPPTIRKWLSDPAKSLFISEGARKADAAVSMGLCCIDVLGVWNWRGTNKLGGKTVLADWEHVALNSRDVHIVFDSDVMIKPEVRAALGRLQSLLKQRGANVSFAYLPPGEGGEKVGLDDFFAAGNDIQALMALLAPELQHREDPEEETHGPYVVKNGRLCHQHCDRDDEVVVVPLCNFEAYIRFEVVRDDGLEQHLYLEIEGKKQDGSALPKTLVPAAQFASMSWVLPSWGVGAVISAGMGNKDRLREAIQVHSTDAEQLHIYTHTGWCEIDGDWVYLHANGAIGDRGNITSVIVEPEGPLAQIYLNDPLEGDELRSAIKASLEILELAPDWIAVPTLAAVYRATLSEILTADFSLHYAGSTGVFKSEIAALAQAHFGVSFRRENLPANWSSTANFLEYQAFLAKDTILVIDDFSPCGTQADVARFHRDADRVFRGAGNRSGRGRLRSDGTARRSYIPRCLLISTGEDLPRGQSLRSRLLVVEVNAGDVDPEKLTLAQQARNKGDFAAAMSGFLRWFAPQLDVMKRKLPKLKQELCSKATRETLHRRIPDIVANLALGLKLFLEFAWEIKAISERQKEDYWHRSWVALGQVAGAQVQHQFDEDPTNRFLSLISAAITSGNAYVSDRKSGEEPVDATCWGWREVTVGQNTEWRRLGAQIGWLDGNDLYLEPDTAFAVAQRLARDQGDSLPVNKNTLWKRLKEKGLLASFKEGRNLVRVSIGSKRRYAIHVLADTLDGIPSISGPRGPVGPTPSVDEGFSPSEPAPKSNRVENRDQKPGPEEFRLTADLPGTQKDDEGFYP